MEVTNNPPPQQMEDKEKKESPEKEERGKEEPLKEEQQPASPTTPKSGGGLGGWGFSAFSVLSDLQKAATVAAEEISRNVRFIFSLLIFAYVYNRFIGSVSFLLVLFLVLQLKIVSFIMLGYVALSIFLDFFFRIPILKKESLCCLI